MKRIKLTEKNMASILLDRVEARDIQFPLVVRPWQSGLKATVYFVKRKPGDKNASWVKLGTWPDVTIKVFRERATTLLSERVLQRPDAAALSVAQYGGIEKVSDLLQWYSGSVIGHRDLSGQRNRNVASIIRQQLLPAIGELPTRTLSQAAVRMLLVEPMAAHGYALSYMALTIRTLKQIYTAAIKAQLLESSPVADLKLALFTTATVKNKPAAYHPGQISEVIKRIKQEPCYKTRSLIAIALLHGLRVSEVAGLCWQQHVDITGKMLRLGGHETKNRQAHMLPLTDVAVSILLAHKQMLRRHGHRGQRLFPAARNPRASISRTYASALVSGSLSRGAAHDLRKLARDWWQLNGIDFYIGELMLNHKGSAMLKTAHVYMQSTLIDNYRQALQRWHGCLMEMGLMEAVCCE